MKWAFLYLLLLPDGTNPWVHRRKSCFGSGNLSFYLLLSDFDSFDILKWAEKKWFKKFKNRKISFRNAIYLSRQAGPIQLRAGWNEDLYKRYQDQTITPGATFIPLWERCEGSVTFPSNQYRTKVYCLYPRIEECPTICTYHTLLVFFYFSSYFSTLSVSKVWCLSPWPPAQ